jgi:hypothetical protein
LRSWSASTQKVLDARRIKINDDSESWRAAQQDGYLALGPELRSLSERPFAKAWWHPVETPEEAGALNTPLY